MIGNVKKRAKKDMKWAYAENFAAAAPHIP